MSAPFLPHKNNFKHISPPLTDADRKRFLVIKTDSRRYEEYIIALSRADEKIAEEKNKFQLLTHNWMLGDPQDIWNAANSG